MSDRFLPDKAIDVIDEVGASFKIKPSINGEPKIINDTDIEEVVAKIARIPPRSVSVSDKERLQNLDTDLKREQHGVWIACNRLGQQAALIEADISRRSAD